LGYRGYREFSHALVMELGRLLGAAYAVPEGVIAGVAGEPGDQATTPPDTMSGVVARVLAQELAALHDTVRALDREATERAVAAMVAAQAVLFVGTGAGTTLCELATYRLKFLGLHAAWAGDPGTILPEIHLLRPGDVVCAVSHHGVTRHVVDALDHARERGLTTICVTAVPDSPAARRAEILLTAIGPHVGVGFGQFASRMTAVALLEAITAGVAWARRDQAVPHVTDLMQAIQRRNTVARRPRAHHDA
jgi:DNA-binding MurR/RpiR family transcriptional regulator